MLPKFSDKQLFNLNCQFIDCPTVSLHMVSSTISFITNWFPHALHPLTVVEVVLTDRINADQAYREDGSVACTIDPHEDQFALTDLYIGTLYKFDKGRDYVATDIDATIHLEGNYGLGDVKPTVAWTVEPKDMPFPIKNDYGAKVWVWDQIDKPIEGEPSFRRLIVVGFYS